MSEDTLQQLQWTEEQQKKDKNSSRALTERRDLIAAECKNIEERMTITKKNQRS